MSTPPLLLPLISNPCIHKQSREKTPRKVCTKRTKGKHATRLIRPALTHPVLLYPLPPFSRLNPQPQATEALVQGIVRNANCNGWGKIYLTSDEFDPNPWNDLTSFWDLLVDAVYEPSSSECPPDPQTTLMVPLYFGSNQGAHACHCHVVIQETIKSTRECQTQGRPVRIVVGIHQHFLQFGPILVSP